MTTAVDEKQEMETTTPEEEPVFATGGYVNKRRVDEQKQKKEAARKSAFANWEWFKLAAPREGEDFGESIILRFVTDEPDWIGVDQHTFIPTKPAPADKPSDKKWLERWGAVCRKTLVPKGTDPVTGDPLMRPWYDDCYICENVKFKGKSKNGKEYTYPAPARPRVWAIAVERQEVIGTKEMADAGEIDEDEIGEVVNYEDVLVDHELPDGTIEKRRRWIVINQAWDNFFDPMLSNAHNLKTIVDRDYKVTRLGGGTATDYNIIPLDPATVTLDGKQKRVDLRKEPFKSDYAPPFSLAKIVAGQASKEHYDWYFDPRVETSWEARFGKKSDDNSDERAAQDDSGPSEVDRERLKSMQEQLKAKRASAQS